MATVLVACQTPASPPSLSPAPTPSVGPSASVAPIVEVDSLEPGLGWATVTVERPADEFRLDPSPTPIAGGLGHPGHFPGQAIMADVAASPRGSVAVGYAGLPGSWRAIAWFSEDGRDWRLQQVDVEDPSFASSVAAGDSGLFVAVGWGLRTAMAWTSQDGRTWTRASVSRVGDEAERMLTVTATEEGWIAGGSAGPELGTRQARIWHSSDGITWQPTADDRSFADGEVVQIVRREAGYVAVGRLGTGQRPIGSVAWWSDDGETWTRIDDRALTTGLVEAVAIGPDGVLVAVGTDLDGREAVVWFSPDARTWERLPAEESRLFYDQRIRMTDVVATAHGFIAVGDESSLQRPTAKSWLSSDGRSWTKAPGQASMEHAEMSAIAEHGRYLVAVGIFGAPDNAIPVGWISPVP